VLLLPGCLVSFNDYPLELSSGASGDASLGGSAGKGGASGAGTTAGKASGGAGTSGASGTHAGGGQAPSSAPATMIDDFEDGDRNILEQAGRSGAWYAANDGQGMQTPPGNSALIPSSLNLARGSSLHAAHTFGGPFGAWGALIGTSLAADGAYDVSAYDGIRLWVRSGSMSPTAAKQVRLSLLTPQTNMGGSCTVCNDHFGAWVPLTPQWTLIELPFSDVKQEGFGVPKPPAPDLTRVTGIELFFPMGVSFDLWVDDIELF